MLKPKSPFQAASTFGPDTDIRFLTMRFKAIFLTAAFVVVALLTSAQIFDPVKWTFSATIINEKEAEIVASCTIEPTWHVYATKLSDKEDAIGPIPTTFVLKSSKDFKMAGKVSEGKYITHYDPNFEMDLNYFESKAVFKQKIKINSDKPFTVSGEIQYMACNDERCIFPDPEVFTVMVSPKGSAAETPAADTTKSEGSIAPSGGIIQPLQWTYTATKISDTEFEIVAKAVIEEGYHVYSAINMSDGPMPTELLLTASEKYQTVGSISEMPAANKHYDKDFATDVYTIERNAEFKQRITIKDAALTEITGEIKGMVCKEVCAPFSENFKIDLKTGVGVEYDPLKNTPSTPAKFQYSIPTIDLKNPIINDCGSIQSAAPAEGSSLWKIFLLGFLGGLVALLTPCVFPMIPLTVSFFTKGSENRKKGITNAVIYGAFIFLIYIVLSLPFHIFDQIDENILNNISTNVPLNVFFFIVFVVFAISFFGYFEITLPSSLANKMDQSSNVGGLLGSFFMAATLAIVSFSCTGPILGSLLAGSLSKDGGAIQLTAGMGGFGLALGIPFAFFAAFPGMLKSLPKSGGWLNSVKVVLGFAELALALKFLSNADLVDHWGFLKYELFMGLWIIIFALMAIYLLGKIKFPHDSILKKLSFFRVSFAVLVISWVIYLCAGFRYDERYQTYHSLPLLSGLAPPVGYSWIYPKDCPHNINCEHDYLLALERAKAENKPIFIDFTGYACVNCRKMEEHVWIEPDVLQVLNENYIVASLYVDDRQDLPALERETFTSAKTGKTKKIETYGDRWAAFEIETFNSNSQPFYCLITPDEKLLTFPVGYTPNKDEYLSWLKCGLQGFEEWKQSK